MPCDKLNLPQDDADIYDLPANAAALPEKWLLFRLSSLGDVVLCTGVMRYLNAHYGWTFDVLTKPGFAPIFANNPFVREIISPAQSELKFPASLFFFRRVAAARQGWGLLDLHRSLRSRLLAFTWRGPVRRYPKFTAERRKFLKSRSPELSAFLRSTSVTQRYALALFASPPPCAELLPQVYLDDSEKAAARERLAAIRGISQAPLVALHPFATHSRKAWPREYWLELLKMLEAEGLDWILVGQGEALQPGSPRDFTGRTGLRELAALLEQADLLVTGDSGPMHLASAVGTPVVGLFGPTTAEWGFFPAGPRDMVVELQLDCRPCSLHGKASGCGSGCDGRCLAGISPRLVLERILSGLSGQNA